MFEFMNSVQIGDVVMGQSHQTGEVVKIVVKQINRVIRDCDDVQSVSGFEISESDRVTTKKHAILAWTPWTVLDGYELKTDVSFTDTVRAMAIGDEIDVLPDVANINVARTICGRMSIQEGRKYTVNKTDEGCRITRRE